MAGNWDIRRTYLYLVSFATLMMMIIGTVQFLHGVINIAYPNPQPAPMYSELKMRYPEMVKQDPKLTEAEFKKQLEEERVAAAKADRYYRIKSMIESLALILVALPVYQYHWRKIQRSEN